MQATLPFLALLVPAVVVLAEPHPFVGTPLHHHVNRGGPEDLARTSRFEKARRRSADMVARSTGVGGLVARDGTAGSGTTTKFPVGLVLIVVGGLCGIALILILFLYFFRRRKNASTRPKDTPPTKEFHPSTSSFKSMEKTTSNTSSLPSPLIKPIMEKALSTRRFTPLSPALPSATHPSNSDLGTLKPSTTGSVLVPLGELRTVAPDWPVPPRRVPVPSLNPEKPRRPVELPPPLTAHLRQLHATPVSSSSSGSHAHHEAVRPATPETHFSNPFETATPGSPGEFSGSDYEEEDDEDKRGTPAFADGRVFKASVRTLPAIHSLGTRTPTRVSAASAASSKASKRLSGGSDRGVGPREMVHGGSATGSDRSVGPKEIPHGRTSSGSDRGVGPREMAHDRSASGSDRGVGPKDVGHGRVASGSDRGVGPKDTSSRSDSRQSGHSRRNSVML